MKNQLTVCILFVALILNGCGPKSSPSPSPTTAACRVAKFSSSSGGVFSSSVPEYDNDGRLTNLKKYERNSLQYSLTLGEYIVETKWKNGSTDFIETVEFSGGGIFADQLPTKATIALTEGTTTRTEVNTYYFYYDSKSRLNKVKQETPRVVGDREYDLLISYNDQDNVIAIEYVITTGTIPNIRNIITASGYDDKPNPYSSLRTWKYLVSWDYGYSIFAQLSKNNPLGYTWPSANGFKQTSTYTYNDKDYPVIKTNTNSNNTGNPPFTYTDTFDYVCQ
jgi:hypothetical protein